MIAFTELRGAATPRCKCRAKLEGIDGVVNAQNLTLDCSACRTINVFNVIDGRWFRVPIRPTRKRETRIHSSAHVTMTPTERHQRLLEVHDIMGWELEDRICGPLDCPICDEEKV